MAVSVQDLKNELLGICLGLAAEKAALAALPESFRKNYIRVLGIWRNSLNEKVLYQGHIRLMDARDGVIDMMARIDVVINQIMEYVNGL